MEARSRTVLLVILLAGELGLIGCSALLPLDLTAQHGSQGAGVSTALPAATPTLPPFTPEPAHNPRVAGVLRDRPAAGASVEVDAYFDGAGVPPMPGMPLSPERVVCPPEWNSALTDRPYAAALMFLNGTTGAPLPDDAPWLIAVTPEQTRPDARSLPQLPYHARLRGHLDDPAFAGLQCSHADRIFVVEQVVKVYQQDLPDPSIYRLEVPTGYAGWPRFADANLGYNLPYPPGWQAQRLDDVTAALRGPQWPGNPVMVRVHDGEARYDQYDPASLPPLLQRAQGWSVFRQGGWPYDQAVPPSQGLDGYVVQRDPEGLGAAERSVSAVFAGNGRTYELALTYPTGFGASPELLTDYTAIVQGFRLDPAPGPSPTPPINQTLGRGPFLSEEQAVARARDLAGGQVEYLGGQLVPEGVARSSAGACGTFTGHPTGVWLLLVRGQFEGQQRTMRLLLDGVSGEQLCGEEVSGDSASTPDHPGARSTPVPAAPPGVEPPTPLPPGAVLPVQVFVDIYSGRADGPGGWLSATQAQRLYETPAACTVLLTIGLRSTTIDQASLRRLATLSSSPPPPDRRSRNCECAPLAAWWCRQGG